MYADDIVTVAKGKYEHNLCELIQVGIKVTERWCIAMGLTKSSQNHCCTIHKKKEAG